MIINPYRFGGTAPPIIPPITGDILAVDFNDYLNGHIYTPQNAIDDFRADTVETEYSYAGLGDGNTVIITDPDGNPNRGRVLRSTHKANEAFSSFKFMGWFDSANTTIPYAGDIYPDSTDPDYPLTGGTPNTSAFESRELTRTAVDELWFSYDVYLDPNWHENEAHKLPGITTGTALQATHGGPAFAEGIYGFSTRMQLNGVVAFGRHSINAHPSLSWYRYDAISVQRNMLLNKTDGTQDDISMYTAEDMEPEDSYRPEFATWFTIKQHIKMNTSTNATPTSDAAGPEDLSDGLVEVWIKDPRPLDLGGLGGGTGGVARKMLTYTTRFRWWNYFKMDGYLIFSYINNRPGLQTYDMDIYFDNFRVSTTDLEI